MVRPGVTTRKPRVNCLLLRPAHGVDGLPGDEHGHDGGLAGAGGQLQRQAQQLRVGVVVGVGEVLEERACPALPMCGATSVSQMASRPPRPGRRTGGCRERVVPPVLEQARRLRRDLPVVGVRQGRARGRRVRRTSLMIEVGSYCCSSVESPSRRRTPAPLVLL